jgi:hypothetical protein
MSFPLSATPGGVWKSSDTNAIYIWRNHLAIASDSTDRTAILTYTDTVTGCIAKDSIHVNPYPIVGESYGERVVCLDGEIQLSNTTPDGVWTTSRSIPKATLVNPSKNTVTVRGEKLGVTYVTYTVSDGLCETKATYKIRIIPDEPVKVIIGVEK